MSAAVKSLRKLSAAASPFDTERTAVVMGCHRRMARDCLATSKPRPVLASITMATRLDKYMSGVGCFLDQNLCLEEYSREVRRYVGRKVFQMEGVTMVYILWPFSDDILSWFVGHKNQAYM